MRYSRVLTVLALMGVVALTTTLVTHGARSAPKPVRAAAPKRVRAVTRKPTLHSELQQLLQQLQVPLLARQRRAQARTVNPPFHAAPCAVAGGCSINPCVQFAQGGSQPVAITVQGAVVSPVLPGGLHTQRCTRRALPHTLRVSSAVTAAVPVSAAQPAP